MKKIYLLTFFSSFIAFSGWAATYYNRQTAIGSTVDWSLASSWSTAGVGGTAASSAPGSSDDVIIDAAPSGSSDWSGTITYTIPAGSFSCKSLRLGNSTGGSSTIYQLVLTSGSTLTVNGDVVIQGYSTATEYMLTVGSNSTINVAGNITLLNQTGSASTTYNPYSVLNLSASGSTLNLAGGVTNTNGTITINAGSTFNYTGNSAQTIYATNYANLGLSGSGAKTNSGTIGISGTFTPGSFTSMSGAGTINFNGTTAQTIPAFNYTNLTISGARTTNSVTLASSGTIGISGTFTNSATYTTGGVINTGSTVSYNGSAAQTIINFPYNNLTINKSAGVATLGASIPAANMVGDFTLQSGTLTTANFLITGTASKTFTQSNGTTVNISGTSASFPGSFGTYSLGSSSTVNYTGTAAQTIAAIDYGNITMSGAGAKTLSAGTTRVSGTCTNSSTTNTNTSSTFEYNGSGNQTVAAINYNHLTFTSGSARTITLSGTIGIAGTFTPNTSTNTLSVGTSTISYNGTGNQTVLGLNYYNLDISGSRTTNSITLEAATVGVSNALTYSATFTLGSVMNTGNTIVFNGSGAQTIPNLPYNNLTINKSAGTATLGASIPAANMVGDFTLQSGTLTTANFLITGTASKTFTQSNGTTVNISGTSASFPGSFGTYSLGSSSTVNYTGTAAQTIAAIDYGNITMSGAGAKTLSAGTTRVAGTCTNSSTTNTNTSSTFEYNGSGNQTVAGINYNDLTFTSGSARTITLSGTIGIAGTFTPNTSTNTLSVGTSTISYNGTGNQTVLGLNYYNLDISGSRTTNSITLEAATVGVSNALTYSAAFTLGSVMNAGNTIVFNGSGAQTIPNLPYNNLTINKSAGTATLGASIPAANMVGDFTLQSGTLTTANFLITGTASKTFTQSNGTTVNISGTSASFPGSFGTYSLGSSSTVNYTGTAAQTIAAIDYGNITMSGAGAKTIATGTMRIFGTITNSSTVSVAAGSIVEYNGTSSQSIIPINYQDLTLTSTVNRTLTFSNSGITGIAGVFTPNTSSNTLNFGTGVINFNGTGAQTINALNYNRLTISGARTTNNITLEPGTIGVKDTLTYSATFVGGQLIKTGNTISYNGTGTQHVNKLISYNNLTIDKSAGTAQLDTSLTAANLAGNLSILNGTLSTGAGTGLSTSNITGQAGNTLLIQNGATLLLNGGALTASTFPTGFGTYTMQANSTVNYGSNMAQTIVAQNYGNLTSSGTGTRTLANTGTIGIAGNLVSSNNTYTTTGSTIEFNGTGTQTISGNIGTTTTPFVNLKINNSGSAASAGLQLAAATAVSGVLTLTAGQLLLNGQTLTLSNAATTAISRTSGVIVSESTDGSGKVQWNIGSTTGSHLIPFGRSTTVSDYVPFTLNNINGTAGNVTVATYHTASDVTPLPTGVLNVNRNGSSNSANLAKRFWVISATGQITDTASLTLCCTASEAAGTSTLRGQKWNNTAWDTLTSGQSNPSTYSVLIPNLTSYTSSWLMVSKDFPMNGNSPLPVKLISFKAHKLSNAVQLSWVTASEINADYFEVQKNSNGKDFISIGRISSAGNTQGNRQYEFMDDQSNDATVYYRLKEVDLDGNYTYSNIVAVNDFSDLFKLEKAYPNPVEKCLQLNIRGDLNAPVIVRFFDYAGKLVQENTIEGASLSSGDFPLNLETLKAGLYLMQINQGNHSISQKITKE